MTKSSQPLRLFKVESSAAFIRTLQFNACVYIHWKWRTLQYKRWLQLTRMFTKSGNVYLLSGSGMEMRHENWFYKYDITRVDRSYYCYSVYYLPLRKVSSVCVEYILYYIVWYILRRKLYPYENIPTYNFSKSWMLDLDSNFEHRARQKEKS